MDEALLIVKVESIHSQQQQVQLPMKHSFSEISSH